MAEGIGLEREGGHDYERREQGGEGVIGGRSGAVAGRGGQAVAKEGAAGRQMGGDLRREPLALLAGVGDGVGGAGISGRRRRDSAAVDPVSLLYHREDIQKFYSRYPECEEDEE